MCWFLQVIPVIYGIEHSLIEDYGSGHRQTTERYYLFLGITSSMEMVMY